MNNYYNNDNPVILNPTNSRNNNNKKQIYCVICFPKIELTLINEEENRYKCNRCKNTYQPRFEIFPEEDELESIHEEQNEGPIIISGENNITEPEQVLNENKRSDIKISWYMKDSATTKVTYYREE